MQAKTFTELFQATHSNDITKQINEFAKANNVEIVNTSLTTVLRGYVTAYYALVVFKSNETK